MLTLNALNTMGIKLHGLIFNNYKEQFFEDDNIKVILELSKIKNYMIIKNGQKEISDKEIEKFFNWNKKAITKIGIYKNSSLLAR